MTPEVEWETAKKLVFEALELEPGAREQFLDRACENAPDLLAEVQSLLSWVDQSGEFLETPAVRIADLVPEPEGTDPLVGQSLGPWRILDVIGHGGMGAVYRAERADAAFKRVVAIKVVRHGSHAADIIERFHRERETLAALDHPNIARLIDGGTTPAGQPYFVMEYVDGVRVDRYCDEQRLSIERRLNVFRTICAAVQYAHHNLVVHRDLKPDNILVSRDGTPKLLDFGIARMLSDTSPRTEHDVVTTATWMLTPDYASPEQIQGGAMTTASDVYSLGVLLHVLLTGLPPYRLRAGSPSELGEQLATTTVARPSESFGEQTPGSRERAAARASTPRLLSRRITGDIDAIVLRALARDVPARYHSVDQLVDELDRHTTHHPVVARGDHWSYLGTAFCRRHRVALSLAAAFVTLAAAGVAAVLWQASIAAEARARAERRFEDVRHLARAFIFDVDNEIVNVPGTTRARALMMRTASEYLDGLAREAHGDLGLQRELASTFVKVGDAQGHPTSANVGDTAGARASYRRAIDISSAVLAIVPDDLDAERTRAMAHRRLSDVLAWAGDSDTALTHCELSHRLFVVVAARPGATAEDRLQAAIAELKLGDLLGNPNLPNLRRPDEARARYDAVLTDLRALAAAAPEDARVGRYLGILLERIGTMHELRRDWPAAATAYQESFVIRKAVAAKTPGQVEAQRDLAIAYEKLANVQFAQGEASAAEASYRGALSQFDRLAQVDPSNAIAARSAAISRERLASTVSSLGRRQDAIALLDTALATHDRLSAGDPDNGQARCDAARVRELLGDTWALGAGEPPPARACGHWREGARARDELRARDVACVTPEETARIAGKVQRCESR
jgi:non-specific serine/threonine protein kinase/serine/threonine-protein kinase